MSNNATLFTEDTVRGNRFQNGKIHQQQSDNSSYHRFNRSVLTHALSSKFFSSSRLCLSCKTLCASQSSPSRELPRQERTSQGRANPSSDGEAPLSRVASGTLYLAAPAKPYSKQMYPLPRKAGRVPDCLAPATEPLAPKRQRKQATAKRRHKS